MVKKAKKILEGYSFSKNWLKIGKNAFIVKNSGINRSKLWKKANTLKGPIEFNGNTMF